MDEDPPAGVLHNLTGVLRETATCSLYGCIAFHSYNHPQFNRIFSLRLQSAPQCCPSLFPKNEALQVKKQVQLVQLKVKQCNFRWHTNKASRNLTLNSSMADDEQDLPAGITTFNWSVGMQGIKIVLATHLSSSCVGAAWR